MNLSIRSKLFAGFGLVLLVLVVAIGVGVRSTGKVNSDAQTAFAEDAIPLKALASDLLTQMVNEETGVRGYLITGDEASLDPYKAGREAVKTDLEKMKPLLEKH